METKNTNCRTIAASCLNMDDEGNEIKESEEEMLIAELARLTTLLNLYENNEEFMKAAIIKRKLEIIQNKLDKL